MAAINVLPRRDFDDVLPWLVSIYMRGCLVPFLGAGMSNPRLALWEGFVWNLETEADVGHPSDDAAKNLSPEVRAQRACAKIRNSYGHECFLDAIGRALKGTSEEMPPQTTSLAAIRWPLVVSTNYDDLYFGACWARHLAESEQAPQYGRDLQVIGRSPKDCKLVMSALHGPFDRQYIWHVQGFLGGQYGDGVEKSVDDLEALQDQLVVGHAEYRCVANASSPHFRRCFGEMFGSRSFLFLGSSLSEPYFMNLFGEVLDLRGPSAVPHFAFTKKGAVDAHFLAAQMNITVCEFDDYPELAVWLTRLKGEIESPPVRNISRSYSMRSTPGLQSDLEITTSEVSLQPCANEAIALVARRDEASGRPILKGAYAILDREYPSVQFIGKHVVQYGNEELYAVTARCRGDEDDTAVAEAMTEVLNEIESHSKAEQVDRKAVHVQMSATGGTVPPVFAFMEVVRAFGQWKRDNPNSKSRLILHIGFDLSLNLTAERIDVQELLSSEFIRFWAVVVPDRNQEPTRRILHYRTDAILREVFKDLGIPFEKGVAEWSVSVCPSPRPDPVKERTWALQDRTLLSIGVVFGSILMMECCGAARCFDSAAAGH